MASGEHVLAGSAAAAAAALDEALTAGVAAALSEAGTAVTRVPDFIIDFSCISSRRSVTCGAGNQSTQ